MREAVLGFAGFVVTLLAVGCGDPDKDPGGSGGAGATAGSSGSGGAGTGGTAGTSGGTGGASGSAGSAGSEPACNELTLDAPAWSITYDAGPAPEPEGGEIADGTYFAFEEIVYETESGIEIPLARSKVVIDGSTWQEVEGGPDAADASRDHRRTSTATLTGTHLKLTRTCGGTGTEEAEYTAEDAGFMLFFSDAGKNIGAVFEKQ